jgi:hypothetical protein
MLADDFKTFDPFDPSLMALLDNNAQDISIQFNLLVNLFLQNFDVKSIHPFVLSIKLPLNVLKIIEKEPYYCLMPLFLQSISIWLAA